MYIGRKRSFDAEEPKEVEKDVIESSPPPPPPPPKRKIIVRSSTQEGDKETNRSSTYKRLEIVRVSISYNVIWCTNFHSTLTAFMYSSVSSPHMKCV